MLEMIDQSTIATILTFIGGGAGGGAVQSWLNYRSKSKEQNDTTQQSLINQLNNMLSDERKRCDESMMLLNNRIKFLESSVIQVQKVQTVHTEQVAQLQTVATAQAIAP